MKPIAKVLSILAGVFVVLLAITIYIAVRAFEKFSASQQVEFPAELKAAKVTTGEEAFQKSVFYEKADLGTITELRYGTIGADQEPQLAVVATNQALLLWADGKAKKLILFPANVSRDAVVLLEPIDANHLLFLSHGSWSSPSILFDGFGNVLFSYGEWPGVNDAAAGDLNGDGKVEVAIGMNGAGGVRLLDANGNAIWSRTDGNVWHVEMLPASGGVPGRILHSNAGGTLVVRDHQGNVLERKRLDTYLDDFTLTRWGGEPAATHIVAADVDTVYVYTSTGEQVASFDAPAPALFNDVRATSVRFSSGQADFAVLRYYVRWQRSVLCINRADRGLVYREILADRCDSLAAMPDSGDEALLVGCHGRILRYALSPSATAR